MHIYLVYQVDASHPNRPAKVINCFSNREAAFEFINWKKKEVWLSAYTQFEVQELIVLERWVNPNEYKY